MLRPITKLLITLSGLAPASILIMMLDYEAVAPPKNQNSMNAFWAHVEPSILIKVLLYVGFIAFLSAIVSTILDMRRSRS
jgi:hypothetical protein